MSHIILYLQHIFYYQENIENHLIFVFYGTDLPYRLIFHPICTLIPTKPFTHNFLDIITATPGPNSFPQSEINSLPLYTTRGV